MVRAEDITGEPCYKEASDVTNEITNLIHLFIDRSQGGTTRDDEIEFSAENLTRHQLSLRRCITRFIVSNRRM